MATSPARNSVYLVGGPCDGETRKLTDDQYNSGTLVCQGKRYNIIEPVRQDPTHFFVEFGYEWKASSSTPGLSAPHALGGWQALRKSVNRGMPDALSYSQRLSAQTLRSLARARRVRL